MPQLLIMRHAKSDWSNDFEADFDRPLNRRGEQAAPRVGRWLQEQRLIPDHVLCSPAKRARQTAERVCGEIGFALSDIRWEPRIYEAGVDDLLMALAACPQDAQRVLLIGHNPGLENLLVYLCAEVPVPAPADGKLMPTAAVAHVELFDAWTGLDAGSGRLLSLTRARELE